MEELKKVMKKRYGIDSICDALKHVNVGLVAVRFKENGRKSFVVVMMAEINKFIERNGLITCYEYGTLQGLVNVNTKPKKYTLQYEDFMNEFIRPGNYFCSNMLLDI